jgi:hypothetical protein
MKYHDCEGNEISLAKLVRIEPVWAANRIEKLEEDLSTIIVGLPSEQEAATRDLQQQAKGVRDALNYIPDGCYLASSASVQEYLGIIRIKALNNQQPAEESK